MPGMINLGIRSLPRRPLKIASQGHGNFARWLRLGGLDLLTIYSKLWRRGRCKGIFGVNSKIFLSVIFAMPANRHSRVSGNPDGTALDQPHLAASNRRRIPAYAGMTVGAVNHRSIPTQNPVYPVYPCLNPDSRLRGKDGGRGRP